MMINFEMDSRDLVVILLIGQLRLNLTLNQGIHESLRQRIVMNYHMKRWGRPFSFPFLLPDGLLIEIIIRWI